MIYCYIQNAQLCRDTQLKVFPFAGAQHLSDFTFTWKRNRVEKGTENELPIEKVTADDCTGYFCCEVSKNGTPYFTSYHSLKQCKFLRVKVLALTLFYDYTIT